MAAHECKHVDGEGIACGETFPRIADLRAHSKDAHGVDLSPRARDVAPTLDGAAEAPDSPPATATEVAPSSPEPPKQSLREKARALVAPKAPEPKPAKSKKRAPRVSTARGFSAAWKRVGTMLVVSGADVPVGRALIYQSPRAGEMLDNLVADTFVDKAIQPLARKGEALAELGSLVMLPVLVGMYERTGSPLIEQMLREVMREHLTAMLPLIAAQREEEKKNAQLVRDMGLDPGDDAIGAVLFEMFRQEPADDLAGSDGVGGHASDLAGASQP